MYSVAESVIYLVDWGSATTPDDEQWEGTLHYTSAGTLQQLVSWYSSPEQFRMFHSVKATPADDLESLVANMFCITHPAAHDELELLAHEPAAVLDWWCQTWATRMQWQRAVQAARATDYDLLAARLQALME